MLVSIKCTFGLERVNNHKRIQLDHIGFHSERTYNQHLNKDMHTSHCTIGFCHLHVVVDFDFWGNLEFSLLICIYV